MRDIVQCTLINSCVHHPLHLHFSPYSHLMLFQSGLLKFHMLNVKSAHCYALGGVLTQFGLPIDTE